MAVGLYGRLQQAGIGPGRDLSVIGFRHNPQLSYLDPELAGFSLDLAALGHAVADSVAQFLRSDLAPERSALVWPMHYRPAASVQPPPPAARP